MPSVTYDLSTAPAARGKTRRTRRGTQVRRLSQGQLEVVSPEVITCNCTEGRPWLSPLLMLLVIVAYIGVGIIFYHYTEGWSFVESMYFSMVTMSTVGYGDYTPSSAGSRAFTVVYTLVGIVLIFTQVGGLMSLLTQPCYDAIRRSINRAFPRQAYDIDGNGKPDYYVPSHPLVFYSSGLLGPLVTVLLVQLIGGALFVQVEGWDFGTAQCVCLPRNRRHVHPHVSRVPISRA